MSRNTKENGHFDWFCQKEGFGDKEYDIFTHHVNLTAGKALYKGAKKLIKAYLKSRNMVAFPRLSGEVWDIDSRKDFYKLVELNELNELEWIDEVILNYPAFCHVTFRSTTSLKPHKLSILYKDYLLDSIVKGGRQFKVAIRFDYRQGGKRPSCIMNIFELIFKGDSPKDPLEEGQEDLYVPYVGDAYAMLMAHHTTADRRGCRF